MAKREFSAVLGALLASFAAGQVAAQEPCTVEPLTAADLGAGPGALNEALACLQERLRVLEQGGGQQTAAQVAGPEPIGEMTILDNVLVSLDYASVVDDEQLVLEYNVTNTGEEPILAVIASFQESRVTLQGEAEPRRFRIQGFATCPSYQTRVTEYCIERYADENWTLLNPGVSVPFQIATRPRQGEIESASAAASVRFILDDGHEAAFQDVSFGRIPLDN